MNIVSNFLFHCNFDVSGNDLAATVCDEEGQLCCSVQQDKPWLFALRLNIKTCLCLV